MARHEPSSFDVALGEVLQQSIHTDVGAEDASRDITCIGRRAILGIDPIAVRSRGQTSLRHFLPSGAGVNINTVRDQNPFAHVVVFLTV